ncbi:MAG TPA: nitrate reductase cytochrome c-type subunit [Burkholderiales bacterium]|nr:nitrate reductase cytochrome c-type subunit [Burkholderiales bacterium]
MTLERSSVIAAAAFAAMLACGAAAQEKRPAEQPLRGATPVPETSASGIYKLERHDRVIPRNHAWQPPIIPHNVKGYQITKNVNMCMVCHAAKSATRTGATPVSGTHYVDRDNNLLPNISARRYFCLQCHVPQFDAEPLVENTFKSPR